MGSRIEPAVLKDLSYGLYVMTSLYNDQMNGQIVNSVNQVTSEPVRIAVTVNKKNLTHDFVQESKLFGISILDETTPMSFFELFGFTSGRDVDKLSQVRHRKGFTGCPLVHENALSFVEAVVFKEIDLGSHTIFIVFGYRIVEEIGKRIHRTDLFHIRPVQQVECIEHQLEFNAFTGLNGS